MPLGTILSKQAINTLTQLHAELAGKIEGNRKHGDKLRMQMMQVEAVIKMLRPGLPHQPDRAQAPQHRQSLVQARHSI